MRYRFRHLPVAILVVGMLWHAPRPLARRRRLSTAAHRAEPLPLLGDQSRRDPRDRDAHDEPVRLDVGGRAARPASLRPGRQGERRIRRRRATPII